MLPYNHDLKERARQLRRSMTVAERRLWENIRLTHLKRYRFYRQKPIGEYIVDFYSHRAKLVIEVDGSQHLSHSNRANDKVRDEYLGSLGLRVLRFTNDEVMNDIDGVVEKIMESIGKDLKSPLNPPLPKGDIPS